MAGFSQRGHDGRPQLRGGGKAGRIPKDAQGPQAIPGPCEAMQCALQGRSQPTIGGVAVRDESVVAHHPTLQETTLNYTTEARGTLLLDASRSRHSAAAISGPSTSAARPDLLPAYRDVGLMPAVTLDQLANAYGRAQRAIARSMEDTLDFINEQIFSALELDQNIVDAGFFVLIFGLLESRINLLAARTQGTQASKNAIREAKFEKRVEVALREHPNLRTELDDWYSIRSDPAHGRGIAPAYDIAAVLERARQLEALLGQLP